ncbi:hypothetical protein [Bifidobacterium avesanii]|uniref:Uncharacterized protein n=1 Tax=Bifidobacterium avesanii TaxID=1798157 RepID=A0A7K3TGV4_9BIFI|nr:hypothetical protein [Bifidobacterium avesanii]NEG77904.1 hypothetical protein [Bifidobacterium avesanii]
MNAQLKPPSPGPQLSAVDALASLAADREAVARKFATPLWYDAISAVFCGLAALLLWGMVGAPFTFATVFWSHAVFLALMAVMVGLLAALVGRLQRGGVHWLAWPPTLRAWAYAVVALIVGLGTVAALPILHAPWWAAAPAAAAMSAVVLLCSRLSNHEVRRYILAGGSMTKYQFDSGRRRFDKHGELWTMARFLELPEDERRAASARVVAPRWAYPAFAVAVMAAIGAAAAGCALALGGFTVVRAVACAVLLIVAAALFVAVSLQSHRRRVDDHMLPPTMSCWLMALAMAVTFCIPVWLAGYSTGAALASPGVVPVAELVGGGAAYVVLFSVFGWMYDRQLRDAIVRGL